MDGPFSYQKWIEGLRAGKSFVTNGPMLELSVDGKGIGGEVKLPSAGEVHVRATVASQFPLDRLEVLYNGKVMATAVPVKKELTTELDPTIPIKSSGWIAARAVGPAAADVQGEWLHGHTSPVYVVVGDKPPGSADDARYFLAWIDRLWDTIQERDRFPDRRSQAEVEAEVNEARKVYGKIIDKAARTTR